MSRHRYTKAEREQAALICAIAASNPEFAQAYDKVCRALGIELSAAAYCLAVEAWDQKLTVQGEPGDQYVDAEAEALIRTGWYT